LFPSVPAPPPIAGGFDEAFPCIRIGYPCWIFVADGWLLQHDFQLWLWRFGAEHRRAAPKHNSNGGATSYIFSDGDRAFAFELSVAKKQLQDQRRDRKQLHNAGNDERRQRREV
jgi:hypothetical protein